MPASNPAVGRASVDPRAARTQAAIKEAFEQMACEADAGRITVKELAERAGINRRFSTRRWATSWTSSFKITSRLRMCRKT